MEPNAKENIKFIPIDSILPDPDQPRKFFDENEEQRLADNIRIYGLLQPIMVRPIKHPAFDYCIVFGERRYRAHKRLGLQTIKVIIKEMDDSEARDLQLLENIHRSDLSDIELAWEFQRRFEDGQTHQQIAKVIGRNRSYVTQRLSLLQLSDSNQQKMLKGELGFSKARILLSVKDPEKRNNISKIMDKGMTVKKLQSEIRDYTNKMVPRVTSVSHVNVKILAIRRLLLEEDCRLKKVVPKDQLISALIKDIKMLS